MPPSTLAEQAVEEARKAFDASKTPGLSSQPSAARSSNAALDPESLKALWRRIFGDNIRVSTLSIGVTATKCRVLYGIDKSEQSERKERVFVEVTQCQSLDAAEAEMKDYLLSFQGRLSEVVQSAKIGSSSLQTLTSVFWVRDTVFAKVLSDDISGVHDSKSAGTGVSKVAQGPAPLISSVAQTLDKYLDDSAMPPGKQLKPRVVVRGSNSITVQEGETFTITLTNADALHKIKPVEIEHQDVVIPTRNGSALGEYQFYALKPGKTKVKIIAVHESSLVVGYQEVDVIVQAEPSS